MHVSGQCLFSINHSKSVRFLSIRHSNDTCAWASWALSINRDLSPILHCQQCQGSFPFYSLFTALNSLPPFYSQFSYGRHSWGYSCSRITAIFYKESDELVLVTYSWSHNALFLCQIFWYFVLHMTNCTMWLQFFWLKWKLEGDMNSFGCECE